MLISTASADTSFVGIVTRVNTFVLLVFALASPCALLAADKRATLEEVDQVVQKAGSVQGLLEDGLAGQGHRDAYFEVLRSYFDHPNFTRERYDALLNQLRRVSAQVPELAPRLWEATDTGTSFDLTVPMNANGRTIGEKWESHYMDYIGRLERQAGVALKKLPDGAVALDEEWATAVLRSLKTASADHQKARDSLKRQKDRAVLDAAFYQGRQQDPKVKALSSALVRNYFEQEQVKDWMATKNADVILETLKDLYRNPLSGVPASLVPELPAGLNSAMRNVLLDPEALVHESAYQKLLHETRTKINFSHPLPEGLGPEELSKIREVRNKILSKAVEEFNSKQGALFPVPIDYSKMTRAQIVPSTATGSHVAFRAIPRRIHGIWKGIPLGECVGGRYCSDEWMTPRRWATAALAGTQIHFVEVEDVYQGFTQQTPAMIENKVHGSLELGSSVFGRQVVLNEDGTKRVKTLYEIWLPEANRRRPSGWKSLVLGSSNDIDNAGVLRSVRTTDSYNLKLPIMMSSKVRLVDEAMAAKIEAVGVNNRYGTRMIVDAVLNEGEEMRSLSPATLRLKSKEHLIKLLTSPGFAKNPGFAESVLRQIPKSWFDDEKVLEAVFSHLGDTNMSSRFESLANSLPQTEIRFKLFAAAYTRADKSDGSSSRVFQALIGRTEISGNPWDGMMYSHYPSFNTESLDAKVGLLRFVDKFYGAPGLSDANLRFMQDLQNGLGGAEGFEAFKRILDEPAGPGREVLLQFRLLSPEYQAEILKRFKDPNFLGRASVMEALKKSPSNFNLRQSAFWKEATDLLALSGCAENFKRVGKAR